MADKEKKPILGIYVRIEMESSRYDREVTSWIYGHVVEIENADNQKFNMATFYNGAQKWNELAWIELLNTCRPTGTGELKADLGKANTSEVQRAAKTMGEVLRKTEDLSGRFGRPVTFEQAILRLADVAGAKFIITQRTPERSARCGYNYHFMPVPNSYQMVDQLIEEWMLKHGDTYELDGRKLSGSQIRTQFPGMTDNEREALKVTA